ncbi:hypothetical protein CAEBREN_16954 [Caenorhabditis brenneri]|uniref:Nucleoporin Nup159/Nup146 N-terminal domain-containing protein n=1 Tax=Caenorhabditis brenneri TaxID=135651 RepID=G0MF84_CAEBE|nr:hypothetical protein CAEBREN_16954 [Caenorhabditis brenneri]
MSNDEVAHDVSQVTDFHFHTCRKFRLFSEKPGTSVDGAIVRNRLATSSQLGVTFALVTANQMVCFPTKSLINYKLTRENMNVEVTELDVKTINLAGVEQVNDVGINSDGTLLAVLHTRNNDVSVEVFDIKTLCTSPNSGSFKSLCSTRVGTEQTNQGSCLEWNPAFPDTFAAASTDRSIMVAKINPQNPSSQTLIGIGKLGAVTTAISWSPKGKQLTIGDSLGKIVQLKPELDVVRSQFGPEHNPAYGKVTGLCWLATTEWLVSFERGTDHDAYLMRCKKDKKTEWMQYHELSYSSSKWPLPPQLFPATAILVDWNVVIVGNSKTSEISTVGKREDWQTWVSVEGEGIYLPTTASGKDTIPIGLAIDRSMTEEVLLKPDGSQKHRPSPLVMCLTNDGILTAHHIISTFPAHNPCQIASQCIPIAGLSKQQFETTAAPAATSPFSQLAAKPSTIFEQKPQLEPISATPKTTSAIPPSLASSAAPKTGGLFGLTSTPTPSTPFGISKPAAAPSLVSTPKAAPVLATPVKTESSPPAEVHTPEDKKAERLAAQKKVLVERVVAMNKTMSTTKDSIMKMSFAVGTLKSTVRECAETVKSSLSDSKEVMDELRYLILAIERMSDRTQHTVKEMDFEIDEKMELVTGVEDGERVLEKLRNMSETEKLMRFNKLETSADLLKNNFEECCDKMKKLKMTLSEKESLRKQAVLSPLRHNSNLNQLRSGAESDVALKVLRNVSKIIVDTREKIQQTELEFVRFRREASKGASKNANKKNTTIHQPSEMSILEGDAPQRATISDADIVKARQALVARIQKRGTVKTRNVNVESYKKISVASKKKDDPIDTSNLSNAILKLSMTPRRVMTTSSFLPSTDCSTSKKSDAATQADEPPIIQKVVVTVETPAKPVTTAPVTSVPVSKPATTTTTSTIATPSISVKKEEVKEQKPSASLPMSSSIFSGSLFGSKTSQASTGTSSLLAPEKSSIFNSSLTLSPPEPTKTAPKVTPESAAVKEEQPTTETPKEPVKEVPKVKEEKEEAPKAEEAKVVPEASVPAVTTPTTVPVAVEEKKEESTPKTASFSFNSTPSTTTSTSSIFGGGLKQTPGSTNTSSIFGGSAQATPVTAAKASSIFGGAAAQKTPVSTSNTSSIFGGGAKAASSPFGNFGQNAQATQAQNTPSAASAVSFSFNTGAAPAPAKSTGFGSFGSGAPAKPSSVFGGGVTAPTVPNVDDGMEDDSVVSGGGPGGFMSGLGNSGSTNTSSSGNNPFAPKPSTTSTTNSSWLFGGGAKPQEQTQQKPSFSFANPSTNQPAASTSTSSVFGAGPKFGSQPVFGSKPFGGGAASGSSGLSKNASIFGGAVSSSPNAPATGGFAQFATGQKTSSLFGGGATTQNQQANTSIFGGGAQTPAASSSSIFGGGSSANANKPSSFSSWR